MKEVRVIGFGLAGACVALALKKAGFQPRIVDEGGGSTLVAAGLVSPVAGRDFEPSWELAQFLPEAVAFYRDLEKATGRAFFHEMPIFRRWMRGEKDRRKFEAKRKILAEWVDEVTEAGVRWKGGGWMDTGEFLKAAREFLEEESFLTGDAGDRRDGHGTLVIRCTGARGLRAGEFADLKHLCAKGEILTLRIPDFSTEEILSGGGWLIPIGGDFFKVGATYEWDELDRGPTAEGREKVEKIAAFLTNDASFEVVNHEAGVRPIVNYSVPVVEFSEKWGWMMNGLGSKGVIYAPRTARLLVERLAAGM